MRLAPPCAASAFSAAKTPGRTSMSKKQRSTEIDQVRIKEMVPKTESGTDITSASLSTFSTLPPTHGAEELEAAFQMQLALSQLPSERSKHRVLEFVNEFFKEKHGH
jgi:hypothetical protein